MKETVEKTEKLWQDFLDSEQLTQEQLALFQRYYELLVYWNEKINLTAITGLSGIIRGHFMDSLAIDKFVDFSSIKLMVDIGSGAGVPGIPLKIKYPHLSVILIEVTRKKREFLEMVIAELGLTNIEVCEYDWRTFIRTIDCEADLFVTRAALEQRELCRMFKPGCSYKNAQLVAWVARPWEPDPLVKDFVRRIEDYKIAHKRRSLVFFGLPPVQ